MKLRDIIAIKDKKGGLLMEMNYEKEVRMGLTPVLNPLIANLEDDCILTPEDMAEYMGLSVRQVRRYCQQGKIKSLCYGRKYVVYGNDFKEFLQKSIVRPESVRGILH